MGFNFLVNLIKDYESWLKTSFAPGDVKLVINLSIDSSERAVGVSLYHDGEKQFYQRTGYTPCSGLEQQVQTGVEHLNKNGYKIKYEIV